MDKATGKALDKIETAISMAIEDLSPLQVDELRKAVAENLDKMCAIQEWQRCKT